MLYSPVRLQIPPSNAKILFHSAFQYLEAFIERYLLIKALSKSVSLSRKVDKNHCRNFLDLSTIFSVQQYVFRIVCSSFRIFLSYHRMLAGRGSAGAHWASFLDAGRDFQQHSLRKIGSFPQAIPDHVHCHCPGLVYHIPSFPAGIWFTIIAPPSHHH